MPIFFFDLTDGTREPDLEGIELADQRAAEREAIRFLGEVMKHEPDRLKDGTLSVDIRNSKGSICAVKVSVERKHDDD